MKHPASLAVLLALVITAGASHRKRNVDNNFKCSSFCKVSDRNNFNYKTGYTYTYNYTAVTTTSLSRFSKEGSKLLITAQADIHVLSRCEFVMQLRDASLLESVTADSGTHSTLSDDFAKSVEKEPIQFSFNDGKIEQVCPSSEDETWVVNVKRGVLSVLQNSMDDHNTKQTLQEVDVTGICDTSYKLKEFKGLGISAITKIKNMQSCTNRANNFLSFPMVSDKIASRSLPLIRSTHDCKQIISDDKIVQIVMCRESHSFKPFSNGENGATTSVSQNLILHKTHVSTFNSKESGLKQRTTLLFQHVEKKVEKGENFEENIAELLKRLDSKTQDGVQSDVPQLFSELVESLKVLEYPEFVSVLNKTNEKRVRKFLLDAMPLVGTPHSMSVIIDTYNSGEISGEEFDGWLTSIAFQTKPTADMITAVTPLLTESPRERAFLGVSSLVHTYCTSNPGCEKSDAVKKVVASVEKFLENGCHTSSRKEQDMVIYALKAIGNMGLVINSPRDLQQCYKVDNDMEVRLAAISAYRRLSCDAVPRSHLLHTYSDMKEDTEVRIAAYLAAMKCPSFDVIQRVKETLYSEDVNQVASFVWTHLTNLQETSNPNKQGIKELLSNEFLQNKFNTDVRKFSRNYEASLFYDSLNIGGTIDSNVVFAPQSYLPRSAMVNLTVDLFGESINILEIGGRAEGLEQYVEKFFGPGGYFPDKSLKNMLQKLRGKSKKPYEDMASSIRELSKSFDAKGQFEKPLTANIYSRIFGNEILHEKFEGFHEIIDGLGNIVNPIDVISSILKNQNIDYTKSLIFIDTSYVIPTSVGLPLQFAVNGSATVGSKVSGKVDMSNMWKDGNLEIEGNISPSVAIEFMGSMAVDAHFSRTGIKTVSTLHSNTFINGKLKLHGGELVDMKLNFPREKMEILDVSSKLFVIHGAPKSEKLEEIDTLAGINENIKTCSPDIISDLFGVQLCGEISYVNTSNHPQPPYFPLTGTFRSHVTLKKTDTFDSYEVTYRSITDNSHIMYFFNMDTPGSQVDRKFKFLYSLDKFNKALKVNALTPFFKLEADGRVNDRPDGKDYEFSLHSNDFEIILAHLSLTSLYSGNVGKHETSFRLSVMEHFMIDLKGRINCVSGSKYSADFSVNGLTENALILSGDLNTDNGKYDLAALINAGEIYGAFQGSVRLSPEGIITKGTVSYLTGNTQEQTVTFLGKLQSSKTGDLVKQAAHISVQLSAHPEYNLEFSLNWQNSKSFSEGLVKFGFGDVIWNAQYVNHFLQYRKDSMDFTFLVGLSCLKKDIDLKIDVKHQLNSIGLASHFLLQSSSDNRLWGSFKYLSKPRSKVYYKDLEAELRIPLFSGSAKGLITEVEKGKYVGHVDADWFLFGRNDSGTVSWNYRKFLINRLKSYSFNIHVNGTIINKASAGFEIVRGNWQLWTDVNYANKIFKSNVTYLRNSAHSLQMDVEFNKKMYSASAVFEHSDAQLSLDVDLLLTRRYTLFCKMQSTAKEQAFTFDVFWNKDTDPSKHFSVSLNIEENEKELRIRIPDRYVLATLTILPEGIESVLEWEKDKKIQLKYTSNYRESYSNFFAEVLTPFPSYEKQMVRGGYLKFGNMTNMRIIASWNKEVVDAQLVAEEESLDRIKILGSLNNTYLFPCTLHIDIDHTNSQEINKILNTVVKISLNNQLIKLESNWDYGENDLVGVVIFQSPYAGYSFFGGNVQYTKLKDALDFSSKIFWSDTKDISLELVKQISLELVAETGTRIYGYIHISVPLEFYKEVTIEFLHEVAPSSLQLVMDVQFFGHIASLHVHKEKNMKITGNGKLSMSMTKEINFHFVHGLEHGTVEELLTASYGNRKLFGIDLHGDVLSLYNDANLEMSAELQHHKLEAKVSILRNNSGLNAAFDGSFNDKTFSFSVTGNNKQTGTKHSICYNSYLTATFLDHDLTLMLIQENDQNSYYTSLEIPGVVKASHTLKLTSFLNWKNIVNITLPQHQITTVQNMSHLKGNFLKMNALLDWNGTEILLNYDYNRENLSREKVEAALISPWTYPIHFAFNYFKNFSHISFDSSLTHQKSKEMNICLFAQNIQNQLHGLLKVNFTTSINESTVFKSEYKFNYSSALITAEWDLLKFGISAEHRCVDGIHKSFINIETPHRNWGQITAIHFIHITDSVIDFAASVGKGVTDSNIFFEESKNNANLDSYLMENSIVTIRGIMHFNDKNTNLIINTTNSFLSFKELSLNCEHTFKSMLKQSLEIYYRIGNSHSNHLFHGEYDFDEQNIFSNGVLNFDFHPSLKFLKKVSGLFQYDLKKSVFEASLLYNDNSMEATIFYSDTNFTFSIKSPFKILNHMSLSLHKDAVTSYLSQDRRSLNFKYNEEMLEISTTASSLQENDVMAGVSVKSTVPGFELITLEYSLAGLKREAKNGFISLTKNEESLAVSGEIHIESPLIVKSSINIITPFEGYENIKFGLNYDAFIPKDFNIEQKMSAIGNINFEINNNNKMLRAEFSLYNGKISGEIKTSFEGYELMKFTGSLKNKEENLFLTLNIVHNGNMFQMNSQIFLKLFSSETKFEIVTPIEGFEYIIFSAKHNLLQKEKFASLSFNVNTKSLIELSMSGVAEPREGYFNLVSRTPFKNYEEVNFHANYEFSDRYLVKFVQEKNGNKTELLSSLTVDKDEATLKFVTPLEGVENVIFSSRYLSDDDITVIMNLEVNEKFLFNTSLIITKHSVSYTLATPFEFCHSFTAEAKLGEQYDTIILTMANNGNLLLESNLKLNSDLQSNMVRINFSLNTLFFNPFNFNFNVSFISSSPFTNFKLIATKNEMQLINIENSINNVTNYGFSSDSFISFGAIKTNTKFWYYPKNILIGLEASVEGITHKPQNFHLRFSCEGNTTDNLDMILVTPIEYFKEFTFTWSHKAGNIMLKMRTPIKYLSEVALTGEVTSKSIKFLASKNEELVQMELEYHFKYQMSNITFSLNFPQLLPEKIEINVMHSFKDEIKLLAATLKIGSEIYSVNITSKLSYKSTNMFAKVFFPLKRTQNIEMQLSYDLGVDKYLVVDGKFNNDKFIDVYLRLHNSKTESKILAHFSSSVFQASFTASGIYMLNNHMHIMEGFILIPNGHKFNVSIGVGEDLITGYVNMVADDQKRVYSVNTSWKFDVRQQRKEVLLSLDFNKSTKYEFQIGLQGLNTSMIQAHMHVCLPNNKYLATAEWDSSDSNQYKSFLNLKWPKDQSILIQGSLVFGKAITPTVLLVSLDSPFTPYKSVLFTLVLRNDGLNIGESFLEINNKKVFVFSSQVTNGENKTDLEYSLESILTEKAVIKFTYNIMTPIKTADVAVLYGFTQFNGKSMLNLQDVSNPVFDINFETPIPGFLNIHVKGFLNFSDMQRNATLLFETESLKWISFISSVLNNPDKTFSFIFASGTPLYTEEVFKIVINHKYRADIVTEVNIYVRKSVVFEGSYTQIPSSHGFKVSAHFTPYDSVSLKTHVTSKNKVCDCIFDLKFENKSVEGSVKANFKEQRTFTVESNVKTSWSDNITILVDYDGRFGNDVEIIVTKGNITTKVKGKLNYTFEKDYKNIDVVASFNDYLGKFMFNASTSGDIYLNVHSYFDTYWFDTKFKQDTREMFGSVFIRTPHYQLREVNGTVNVYVSKGELKHGELYSHLKINNKFLYKLSAYSELLNHKYFGNFSIVTPQILLTNNNFTIFFRNNSADIVAYINDYISLNASTEFSYPTYSVNITTGIAYREHFLSVMSVTDFEKKYIYLRAETPSHDTYELSGRVLLGSCYAKLITPHEFIPNIEFSSQFHYSPFFSFKPKLTLDWELESITYEGQYFIKSNNYSIMNALNFGEEKFINIAASFEIDGHKPVKGISSIFYFTSHSTSLSVKMHVDMKVTDTIIGKIEVKTPFDELPELSLFIKLFNKVNRQERKANGELIISGQQETFKIDGEYENKNFESIYGRIETQLPFIKAALLNSKINFSQNKWKKLNSEMEINIFNFNGKLMVTYDIVGDSLDGKFVFDTSVLYTEIFFGGHVSFKEANSIVSEFYVNNNKIHLNFSCEGDLFKLSSTFNIVSLDFTNFNLYSTFKLKEGFDISYQWYKYSGDLTVQYLYNSENMNFYINISDKGLLKSFHVFSISLQPSRRNYILEIKYENNKHVHDASLMFRNDEDGWYSVFHIESPFTGNKEVTLSINRHFNSIEANIFNIFTLKAKLQQDEGSIAFVWFGEAHSLKYSIERNQNLEANIVLNAPSLLTDAFSIKISTLNKNNFNVVNLAINTGLGTYNVMFEILNELKKHSFHISIHSDTTVYFDCNTAAVFNGNRFYIESSVEVMEILNKVILKHKYSLPLDTEFSLVSPLLPQRKVFGVIKTSDDSFFVFIGKNDSSITPYVHLEGNLNSKERSANLTIDTPYLPAMKFVRVQGTYYFKSGKNMNLTLVTQFNSSLVPISGASMGFSINSSALDVLLQINTPIRHFDSIGARIYIPFTVKTDFSSMITIIFPYDQTYGIEAVLNFVGPRAELRLLGLFQGQKLGGGIRLDYGCKKHVSIELYNPFSSLYYFQTNITGNINVFGGNDVVNFVEWNKNRIQLKFFSNYEKENTALHLQLTTPFYGHEKYDFKLSYENKEHSAVVAAVKLPLHNEEIGLKYNFSYRGLFDFLFDAGINVPFVANLEGLSVLISNKLEDNQLVSVLATNYHGNKVKLTFSGAIHATGVRCDVLGKVNEKQVTGKFNWIYSNEKLDLSFDFDTYTAVKHVGINIISNRNEDNKIDARINYNYVDIIHFKMNSSNEAGCFLTVDNPWQPFSLMFHYNIRNQFYILGEFCWNLMRRTSSTTGFKLHIVPYYNNRLELSTGFKIPSRIVSADFVYQAAENRLEHLTRFSWDENRSLGYQFFIDFGREINDYAVTSLGRVDLPFRSFETNALYRKKDDSAFSSEEFYTDFLWDSLTDRNKKATFKLFRSEDKFEVNAFHPVLSHEVSLRIIKSNFTQIEIEYSPDEIDMIVIKSFYRKLSDQIATELTLQHDSSSLYTHVRFQSVFNQGRFYCHVGVTHKNFYSGLINSLDLSTELDRFEPKLEINIKTDENSLSLSGTFVNDNNGYNKILMEIKSNIRNPFGFGLILNRKRQSAEVLFSFGHEFSNKFYVGVPSRREITIGSYRTINGNQYEDGLVVLKLNSSQLLWTKVMWNIATFKQLEENLFEEYDSVCSIVKSVIEKVEDIMDDDILKRFEPLSDSFKDIFNDSLVYIQEEINNTYNDIEKSLKEVTEMYRRNDFYIRDMWRIAVAGISKIYKNLPFIDDISQFISVMFSNIKTTIVKVYEFVIDEMDLILEAISDLQNAALNIAANIFQSLSELYHNINIREYVKESLQLVRETIRKTDKYIKKIMSSITTAMECAIQKYVQAVEPYITLLQDAITFANKKLSDIENKVKKIIDDVIKIIIQKKHLQWFVDVYATYATWLEELHLQDHFDEIITYIHVVSKKIVDDLLKVFGEHNKHIAITFEEVWNKTSSLQNMTHMKNMLNSIYQKAKWSWNYYEVADVIEAYLHKIILNFDQFLLHIINIIDQNSRISTVQQISSSNFIVQPNFGRIEYSVPLPGKWEGFDEIPKFEFSQESQENFFMNPSLDFRSEINMMNNIYNAIQNVSLSSVLSPFGAVATLAGKHIVTFDKVMYDFVGDCTYLLASDLVDSRFSVLVSYNMKNNHARKSLIFISENSYIDINMNKKRTLLDGKKIEFPFKAGNHTWVTRSRDEVSVNTDYGVQMTCNLQYDVCSLEISGWYLGKTGGLFGTFDNEPSNDMILPNGTFVSDISAFADSWKVGKTQKCNKLNYADLNRNNTLLDEKITSPCDKLYKTAQSPLKKCFGRIDPEPFYSMCVRDMSVRSNDVRSEKDKCLSAFAYVTQCKMAGVEVTVTSDCVQCQMEDGSVMTTDEVKVYGDDTPYSADIVFVVQQAECLDKLNLNELAERLDSVLKVEGLDDMRYSVVGFGSTDFNGPQYYTANGEIWMTHKSIAKAFNKLKLNIGSVTRKKSSFEALWYASQSSFREGVSKTVILIQCEACTEEQNYVELSTTLLENDITLHVLEPDTLKLRKSSKSDKLYGIDIHGAYTSRNMRTMKPSVSLLRQVALPKDLCSVIAFETNGTLFNMDQFYSQEASEAKKSVDVWVRRIAVGAEPSKCQQCMCKQNGAGVGQVFCSQCKPPINTEYTDVSISKEEKNMILTHENIVTEEI